MECLRGLRARVLSSDIFQNIVRHALGVDGDARRAAIQNDAQLLFIQCVGPSALNGELQTARKIEAFLDCIEKCFHLRAG